MSQRSPLPDDLGPEFAVRAGLDAGVSRGRMRAGDLDSLFRGSRSARTERVVASHLTATEFFAAEHARFVARCRAYVTVAPADFRFGFITAARLYGIPLPRGLRSRTTLDAVVAESRIPPRMTGVAGHRMRHLPPLELLDGLPVLPPELVWLSLARMLTADELVVAGDHLVRRKLPLSSLETLAAAVARHGGKPGAARAREALTLVRPARIRPRSRRCASCWYAGACPNR